MSVVIFKLILFGILILPKSLNDEMHTNNSQPNTKSFEKFKVHFLKANGTFHFKAPRDGFVEKHLNTYCNNGEVKTLGRLLETIELQLDIDGDSYTQYEGNTPAEVEEHYSKHRSIFNLNVFSQKRSRLSLSPFKQQCIGIESVLSYNVTFYRQKIDFYRSIKLFGGIAVFLLSGVLSANSIFYYLAGVLVGICSSVLLLIWWSGKLMPKRTMMYGVIIGGWTVGLHILRVLWDNIQVILITYRNCVCWYIIITGVISFFFCYRYGPPRNKRSRNIIKWLLQLMSAAMIYFSTNFKEVNFIIMFMTAVLYYFSCSGRIIISPTRSYKRVFNQKQKEFRSCKSKEHRDGGKQGREIKEKAYPMLNINSSSEESETPVDELAGKYNSINLNCNEQSIDEYSSESDVTLSEQDLTKKKLYPLPGGSFILSKKPPIIITPRCASPAYHRSEPALCNDEQDSGDYTSKNHYSHIPQPAGSYRLSAASSTSDLLVSDERRATYSSMKLQRTSSVQGIQSTPGRILFSARKSLIWSPKIKIENPKAVMLKIKD